VIGGSNRNSFKIKLRMHIYIYIYIYIYIHICKCVLTFALSDHLDRNELNQKHNFIL